VRHVALPPGPWDDTGNVIMGIEGAASFRALIRSGHVSELADPLGQINGYVNEQMPGADYLQAQRIREILQKKMADLFDSFDVLATVSQPLPATPLDFNLETGLSFPDSLGAIGNLCGLPALSVPCGFTEKHLPVGVQFVARAGDDFGVIQAARTFQAHTDWHHRHPKLT
jgi:aspartyl-tRNA(Asn)/glutamyl-tRNA(Gln) amidotransferase subunit A